MIEATGIDVGYDGTLVLNRVELTAQPGRVVGLIGPNGSGKTTLLRTLYRSLRPQAGQVTLDGTSLERLTTREVARLVAVVVQESPVELPFTVAEMVRLGRSPHRSTFQGYAADDHLIAAAALARVGARHLAERTFATLSGGEKQRVLNAQALAQQATHLLLDEPTNHLDVRYQHEVLELVRSIGVTTVIVLHDLNLAARYCDELVLLDQGRVTCVGPPRQVLTPEVLEPVYGVAVRCLEDGDAIQLLFRSATPHTGKGSAPVAVDSDNDLYLDGDPRAERNRLSIARGAGHVTIWSRRLISLGRDQRRSMTVMLVIGLLITTSYVVQGLLVAEALTQVLVAGRLDGVVPILATAVALTVARGGLVWWRESLGAALGEQVCAGLRTRLYRQLARLGPAWLKQTRTGAVQTTLTAPSTRWRSTSGCSCPRRWSAPSARRPSSPTCARSIWSSGCSWRAACSSPGSPNYWDGELPYLDELRRVDAPDVATASQGVLSGNFDVAEALSYAAADQLGRSPNAQLIRLRTATSLVAVMDTTQAPFTDIRVRQAFKLAVDRKAVLNTVFAGFGEVTSDLMMTPSDSYYPDGLTQVAYDPDQAKSLLAAAGFPGGVDIDLWAYGTYSPLAVAYADTAKSAGIRANVQQGNPDNYFDVVYLHDKFYTTDGGQYFPGDLLWYTFGSGSVANESKLNFPAIDELYNKALRTTDTEQQKTFIKEGLALAAKNMGLIIPVMADQLLLAKRNVQGVTHAPFLHYDLRHAYLSA